MSMKKANVRRISTQIIHYAASKGKKRSKISDEYLAS
jgi:hypothetical protein